MNRLRKMCTELIYFPSHGALTYEQAAERAESALNKQPVEVLERWGDAVARLTEHEYEVLRDGEREEMEEIARKHGLQDLNDWMDEFFDPPAASG